MYPAMYITARNKDKKLFGHFLRWDIYVTGPEKTGLIYIKYTYSYYGAYLSFYILYLISINFNEQLRIFCTCDRICTNILCLEQKLFNFKNSKFAQILHVDKTCFLRPGHIFYKLLLCCPIENVWEIWLIKVNFSHQMFKLVGNGQWPTVISSTGVCM